MGYVGIWNWLLVLFCKNKKGVENGENGVVNGALDGGMNSACFYKWMVLNCAISLNTNLYSNIPIYFIQRTSPSFITHFHLPKTFKLPLKSNPFIFVFSSLQSLSRSVFSNLAIAALGKASKVVKNRHWALFIYLGDPKSK